MQLYLSIPEARKSEFLGMVDRANTAGLGYSFQECRAVSVQPLRSGNVVYLAKITDYSGLVVPLFQYVRELGGDVFDTNLQLFRPNSLHGLSGALQGIF